MFCRLYENERFNGIYSNRKIVKRKHFGQLKHINMIKDDVVTIVQVSDTTKVEKKYSVDNQTLLSGEMIDF